MLLPWQFPSSVIPTAYGLVLLFYFQVLWEPFETEWNTMVHLSLWCIKGLHWKVDLAARWFLIVPLHFPRCSLQLGHVLDVHNNILFKVNMDLFMILYFQIHLPQPSFPSVLQESVLKDYYQGVPHSSWTGGVWMQNECSVANLYITFWKYLPQEEFNIN